MTQKEQEESNAIIKGLEEKVQRLQKTNEMIEGRTREIVIEVREHLVGDRPMSTINVDHGGFNRYELIGIIDKALNLIKEAK